MRRLLYPIGSGISDFTLVTGWGSLNDAGTYTTTGTGHDGAGTLTWVMAGDTTQVDGYQENYAGFDIPLTTLYSDWDDDTDILLVYVDIGSMPLTTAKYGLFCGISDDTYANRATQDFVGGGIFPNSATITQATQSGAAGNGTAVNNGTNLDVPLGLFFTFAFDNTGIPRMTLEVDRAVSGLVTANVTGAPVAALGAVANRRLVIGHTHLSTTSGTPILAARVYHKRIRTSKRTQPALQDAPASISSMVIMGHSIANGVGANDGTYGGAAIPGTATIRDGGSTLTNYPDNNGTGPDPGVLPYWVADQPNAKIIRRSTNGQILGGIETTELPGALADCVALSLARTDVDLVVLMIGENDAQNSTESDAYTARLDQTCQLVEAAFPNARIIIQDMRSEDGTSYGQFAAIRAANAAAAALNPTRRKVAAYTGITLNDAVHYDLAGYATAAAHQIAAWDSF